MANEFKVKNGLISYGNMIPSGDFSLGTSDNQWSKGYVENIYLDNVELSATIGTIQTEIDAVSAEVTKLTTSTTVNIGTNGKSTKYLDNAAAINFGGDLIGLVCTSHTFLSGDSVRIIGGTASIYDDDNYTLQSSTSANMLVISAVFAAETFTASTVSVYYNQPSTYTEIQALITAQPKNINNTVLIFHFYDGLYSLSDSVNFINFKNGRMVIEGNDTTSLSSWKKVRVEFPTNKRFYIGSNSCVWQFDDFDIVNTSSTSAPYGLYISSNSGRGMVRGSNFKRTSVINTSFGIYMEYNSTMLIHSCYIGRYTYGLGIYYGGSVGIFNVMEQDGTNKPTYGMYVVNSVVFITPPNPIGATADIRTDTLSYTLSGGSYVNDL